jgi:hypothetical protein
VPRRHERHFHDAGRSIRFLCVRASDTNRDPITTRAAILRNMTFSLRVCDGCALARVVHYGQEAKVMPSLSGEIMQSRCIRLFGENAAQIVQFVAHMAAGRC